MSSEQPNDLADRVKKFFYRRAFLAEQLCNETPAGCKSNVTIGGEPESLTPDWYEPLTNLWGESRIVALIAIEGLAAIWENIELIPKGKEYGRSYQNRFSDFLKQLALDDRMPRVCTPILCFTLDQLELEDHFRQVVFNTWVKQDDEYISHPVYADPSVDELESLYDRCRREKPQPKHRKMKQSGGSLSPVFEKFQYSALIYKYFRNSLVHEYRPSKLTSSFARGDEIGVRMFTGRTIITVTPEDEIETSVVKFVEGPTPQLDLGLGVLTRAVRAGADFIHDLIISRGTTEIPNSLALIEVKPEAKPPSP